MTDKEKFDRYINKFNDDRIPSITTLPELAWGAWQAAKQDSSVEIVYQAEHIKELEAKNKIMYECSKYWQNENTQLQADNQKLREALSIAMINGDYLPAEKAQLLKVLNG